ncbi:hypothetical protein GCM10027515_13400 [Schumannella luteola]
MHAAGPICEDTLVHTTLSASTTDRDTTTEQLSAEAHAAQTTAHPPQPLASPVSAEQHTAQRPTLTAPELRRHRGLIDRLALRLGLALITWSRRPLVLRDRTPWRANPIELRQSQLERAEADRLRYALYTR